MNPLFRNRFRAAAPAEVTPPARLWTRILQAIRTEPQLPPDALDHLDFQPTCQGKPCLSATSDLTAGPVPATLHATLFCGCALLVCQRCVDVTIDRYRRNLEAPWAHLMVSRCLVCGATRTAADAGSPFDSVVPL